ncbi:hypothetical protein C1H46_014051 [Malus baccata]|uniref:Kinesin motor domain-containing protein n=1 Tax=Malus baccata TaxID=106549 RepID=A0A540MNE8_MALBA|nr:hypothetical protein C1H46_014051 [Malus baccata]
MAVAGGGTALSFSVASVVEDVLQQHGTRLGDLKLESRKAEEAASRRNEAAGWLRKMIGVVAAKDMPAEPSEEEFRLALRSGIILCNAINKVQPGVVPKLVESVLSKLVEEFEQRMSSQYELTKPSQKDVAVSHGNKFPMKFTSGDKKMEDKTLVNKNYISDEESKSRLLKQQMIFDQQQRDVQSGPRELTEKSQGVNFRALGDLFFIADQRKDTFRYDVSVQMIEIYNEQVRDLLVTDGSNKRYPLLVYCFYTFFFSNSS